MVKIKHKDFIDAVSIMPCQNSSWIMGLRIYEEGKTQIHLVQQVLWEGSRIDRVYTDIRIANNTKINHIMVSFTYNYNAISIDRFPSRTKTGEDSWCFNNSLLCKARFSSATKTFLFSLERQKNNKQPLFQQSDWWKYIKSPFKENAKIFSKNSTNQENNTISKQNLIFFIRNKIKQPVLSK